MKKLILRATAVVMAVLPTVTVLADSDFYDITAPQYQWCAGQIEEMAQQGYINGYGDGTFRPDNEVTKLEGIALFSRILGSSDEENEEIITLAKKEYISDIEKCTLSWGETEVAYMLYRGALTTGDLTTYIKGGKKNEPITRGEAAVIITRVMGGEDTALGYGEYSLHYTDAYNIPSNIRGYVQYVTDNGIMNGIDDTFYADNTVTRSQVSVMMSRVLEKCGYSFQKVRVNSIDAKKSLISYVADGVYKDFEYTDNTKFYVCGETASYSSIGDNVDVMLIYRNGKIVAVDALTKRPDREITAVYDGYNISSEETTVRIAENEYSQVYTSYVCDASYTVKSNGTAATIRDIERGDTVTLLISGGKVISIEKTDESVVSEKYSNVKITDISYDDTTIYVTAYSEEFGSITYPIKADAGVDGSTNDILLASISVGKTVTLTVLDGEIASVESVVSSKVISATVISVDDDLENPNITVSVDGGKATYQIKKNHTVTINGKVSELSDIIRGDEAVLTFSSDYITSIRIGSDTMEAEHKNGDSFSFLGEVTEIDEDDEYIYVESYETDKKYKVYINSKTEFTDKADTSKRIDIDDIDKNGTVKCYVTKSNSRYIADIIVVY